MGSERWSAEVLDEMIDRLRQRKAVLATEKHRAINRVKELEERLEAMLAATPEGSWNLHWLRHPEQVPGRKRGRRRSRL